MKAENSTEPFRKAGRVVWISDETTPIVRRKTNTGDTTAWEKKKTRTTNTEIGRLCQPRDERYRDNIT